MPQISVSDGAADGDASLSAPSVREIQGRNGFRAGEPDTGTTTMSSSSMPGEYLGDSIGRNARNPLLAAVKPPRISALLPTPMSAMRLRQRSGPAPTPGSPSVASPSEIY